MLKIKGLDKYGFDINFFHESNNEFSSDNGFAYARVVSRAKNLYHVLNPEYQGLAELSGKLLYTFVENSEFPVTGDWVVIQCFQDSHAIIHKVVKRKNVIKRKTAGETTDFQIIAANMDNAVIIQSLENDVNLARINRYLSGILQEGINPVLLLSKSDLRPDTETNQIIAGIQQECSFPIKIIPYSIPEAKNISEIKDLLSPGTTSVFIGTSGAGKSTLINTVAGKEIQQTADVRYKDGKGRHTTSGAKLFVFEGNVLIIDTPGMREFGTIGMNEGIEKTFDDISRFVQDCRFKDCTHTVEKGCAVLEAVKTGEISENQYQQYLKLKKENEFNEMTYYEKRKKDKNLGKFYKQVLKDHKKRKY